MIYLVSLKGRRKKGIIVLVMLMFFSSANLTVFAQNKGSEAISSLQTENGYALYPIPQAAVYDGQEFVMSEQVNIVYERQIDQYTRNFLEEILSEYNKTFVISDEKKMG